MTKHVQFLELLIGPLANQGGGGGDAPSGTIEITENATGINVSQYAAADVAVPPYGEGSAGTVRYNQSNKSVSGYATVNVDVPINQFAAALCAQTFSGEVGDTLDPQGAKVTTIKNPCFLNKQQVTKITFPQCTSIEAYALQYVPALEEVNLNACTSVGSYNFYDQENALKKLNVPALTDIQANSFRYMPVLESVDFTALQTITANTFKNISTAPNTALTRLDLPAIVTINANTLQYFTALKRVNIGANISDIKSGVLSYCTALHLLVFDPNISAVPTLGSSAFLTGTDIKDGTTGKIVVPDALLTAWKEATNWSSLATRITGYSNIPTWDAYDDYNKDDIVKYQGHFYSSLKNGNYGRKPTNASSSTWWEDYGVI